jgi:hypothetical protein
MRVDSNDNDVSDAQFRPPAWFHCGRSPLGSVDFVEPNFCERSLEIRAVVAQQSLGDFTLGIIDRHSRCVGALRTKERAQRRCRALSLWAGIGGIGSPLSRGCKSLPLQQNLNLGGG